MKSMIFLEELMKPCSRWTTVKIAVLAGDKQRVQLDKGKKYPAWLGDISKDRRREMKLRRDRFSKTEKKMEKVGVCNRHPWLENWLCQQ